MSCRAYRKAIKYLLHSISHKSTLKAYIILSVNDVINKINVEKRQREQFLFDDQ